MGGKSGMRTSWLGGRGFNPLIKSCILFLEIDQRGAAALIASHGCPRRTNQTCQERPMDRSLSALGAVDISCNLDRQESIDSQVSKLRPGPPAITGADSLTAVVTPTAVCRAQWLPTSSPCQGTGTAHIILVVTDDGSPRLTSYRRIILNVYATATP